MNMVGQEGPGVNAEGTVLRKCRKAADEFRAVSIIPEDGAAFDPAHHDVVEDVGGIEASTAGHGESVGSVGDLVKKYP